MKILVTGGAGFLGSHVVDALCAAGHDVVVFDRATSEYLKPDQKVIVGDIVDIDQVRRAMSGCEAVYHFAAISDIDEAINKPLETVQVNIMGTANMLEAAREAAVKRFVLASSIYVYSKQGSFYRTSKQASEHLLQDYSERFAMDYTILRYGTLYGPRADAKNSVYRMLRQALVEGFIEYRGTGDEVREYIHVLDAAHMSAQILAPQYKDQIIHLSGRERMVVRDMLSMVNEMLSNRLEVRLTGDGMTGHYFQTPYAYTPKIGRRLTNETHIDLGLGLLDCIQEIDATLQRDTEQDKPK